MLLGSKNVENLLDIFMIDFLYAHQDYVFQVIILVETSFFVVSLTRYIFVNLNLI